MVDNLKELLEELGATTVEGLRDMVYKGTSCGAWVNVDEPAYVSVGSIVEGSSQESEVRTLLYPFHQREFWDALTAVENDVDVIWDSTHGCEDCGPEDELNGGRRINTECESCNGDGMVL
jgi:hypothetical protein